MESLEKLRCTVLEKERLKETERILLNTFNMMKKYVDGNSESCHYCEFVTSNPDELKTHTCNNHTPTKVTCLKCEFEADTNDHLNEHVLEIHSNNTRLLNTHFYKLDI